jgi:hypothetical protein
MSNDFKNINIRDAEGSVVGRITNTPVELVNSRDPGLLEMARQAAQFGVTGDHDYSTVQQMLSNILPTTPEEQPTAGPEAHQRIDAQQTATAGPEAHQRVGEPTETEPEQPTFWQHALAGIAAATRGVAPAAAAGAVAGVPFGPIGVAAGTLALGLGQTVNNVYNMITKNDDEGPIDAINRLLTDAGVPESETKAAQVLQGATQLASTMAASLPVISAAGNVGATPLATPGIGRNMLQQIGGARPGAVFFGETAEEIGQAVGGPAARRGAEEAGVESPFTLDLIQNMAGLASGVGLGAAVELGTEAWKRIGDMTSISSSRVRDPGTAGLTPLTRSELDQGDFMSTARGENWQGLGEGIPFGTKEMRKQRFWENQQQLQQAFDAYGADVDDLGGIPDLAQPLMDDFLSTRGAKLTENVNLRDQVISQMPDEVVPTPKATQYIDEQLEALSQLNDPVSQQLRQELAVWQDSIADMNFGNLNTTRRNLRAGLRGSDKEVIQSQGRQMFDELYSKIAEDMSDYVPDDLSDMWTSSQANLSALADELSNDALNAIVRQGRLNPDSVTPEMITNRLLRGEASDTRRIMAGLSEDGQNIARQAFIADLAKKQDMNDLSPNQFADDIAAAADQAGVIFPPEEREFLVGLKTWFDATRRAEQMVRGTAPGMRGLNPGALPAGGTMMSAPVRGNFWAGVGGTVLGVAGLGKAARIIEMNPYIKDMLRDLADTSLDGETVARLTRLVGMALESQWRQEEE